NELKLTPVDFRDSFVLLKNQQCLLQQVVEIHRVRRLLLILVSLPNVLNSVEQRQEVWELLRQQLVHRILCVDDETEDLSENITFRKADFLRINSCARDNRID